MVDVTPIINAVIALIAAIISIFVIPWLKTKTTEEQRKQLIAWIKIAVSAAEQIYNGPGRGEEKKKYVLDFLSDKGIAIDDESVNAAIESAVQQLNNGSLVI